MILKQINRVNCLRLFTFFLLGMGLLSCRNSKELIYMNNIVNNEKFSALQFDVTEYTIKSGDILYISIKSLDPEVNLLFNPEEGNERTSGNQFQKFTTPQGAYLYGFEVDAKGELNLPIMGKIQVAGKREQDAEIIVQEYADKFLKDALVKVKLLNYKITVLGEVRNPGVYYNYNNKFTVLDAIAMANGNTDFANITRVAVMRLQPDGRVAMVLDLSKKETFMAAGFYLHPNDYVFVEPDRYKNFQLNSQAVSLFFASISMLLAVMGFVL